MYISSQTTPPSTNQSYFLENKVLNLEIQYYLNLLTESARSLRLVPDKMSAVLGVS